MISETATYGNIFGGGELYEGYTQYETQTVMFRTRAVGISNSALLLYPFVDQTNCWYHPHLGDRISGHAFLNPARVCVGPQLDGSKLIGPARVF